MSNILLLPFIVYDDLGNKTDTVYNGLYNLDFMSLTSIEPDEDGDTAVFHRTGQKIGFKVPFIEFCKQLHESGCLNYYYSKYTEKVTPGFINAIKGIKLKDKLD